MRKLKDCSGNFVGKCYIKESQTIPEYPKETLQNRRESQETIQLDKDL